MYDPTSVDLDRSPSLSSQSSGASSASSSAPITPAFATLSSFPSSRYPHSSKGHHSSISEAKDALSNLTNLRLTGPSSGGSPASLDRNGSAAASPWSAGHRSTMSLDTKTLHKSPSSRMGLMGRADEKPLSSQSGMGRSLQSQVFGNGHSSPSQYSSTRMTGGSPTRTSPTRPFDHLQHSPGKVNPSIFSTRAESPAPVQLRNASPDGLGRVGSIRGAFDGSGSVSSNSNSPRALGHRRAMTLPHNGMLGPNGLPQAATELIGAGEVAGLPGRVRLSRPAHASSPFAPSAVFSSSHGLSQQAGSSPRSAAAMSPSMTSPHLTSQSAKAIDGQRRNLALYEYLCRVRETQEWLEACITSRPADAGPLWSGDNVNDFEQSLRDGYALAHLARSLGSDACKGPIYNDPVRHFRHTANLAIFFRFLHEVELPDNFHFETVDCYDGKNLPKVIYCIHALSAWLHRRGITAGMRSLNGRVEFTEEELAQGAKGLDGVRMPNFSGIDKALNKTQGAPPPETERQRTDRLLGERLDDVLGLQAQARGVLARNKAERLTHQLMVEERRRQEKAEEATRRQEAEERRQREWEAAERLRMQREAEEAERRRILAEEEAERRRIEEEEEEERRHIAEVQAAAPALLAFQAVARGVIARRGLLDRIRHMRSAENFVAAAQAHARGLLARTAYARRKRLVQRVEVVRATNAFQSHARGLLERRKRETQRQQVGFVAPCLIGLTAQARAYVGRNKFLAWREHMYAHEESVIVPLQAILRGALVRRRYDDQRRQLYDADDRGLFARMQARIRSARQEEQYRQLRLGTNVPISTLKNFIRLLDDSEFDYNGDMMVEALRKELVAAIKEVQDLEDDVKDLDTKIALLVKNKITHEVARAQRVGGGGGLAPLRKASLLAAAKDPFATDALDRSTQRKLELYQQLFWHLQTSPIYLARLFANMQRLGLSDKVIRAIESTTFVIFGYAQAQREEFLLLKLFQVSTAMEGIIDDWPATTNFGMILQRSIQEEFHFLPSIAAFVRGQPIFARLLLQYGRGTAQRQYLTNALGPQIHEVMQRAGLDLRTDPIEIYKAKLSAEEDRTGAPSARTADVDYLGAISDRDTREEFGRHLVALRKSTDTFLQAFYDSTRSMPYGIRYIAREVHQALHARFPDEPAHEHLRVAGHIVFYRFLQPAIVAPETFGIVEGVMTPRQRQNLSEVCKLLNQISVGRLFGDDQPHLQPMNDYIGACVQDFSRWITDVIHVEDAEVHFHSDAYVDAVATHRPIIYISPNDIYSTHSIIAENLDVVAPEPHDPLKGIIEELGGAPASSTGELNRARADTVPLTLMTRLMTQEGRSTGLALTYPPGHCAHSFVTSFLDPDAPSKTLFASVKRRVCAMLKVKSGTDLEQLLTQEVTIDDEDAWALVVREELEEERRQAQLQRRQVIAPLDDTRKLTFHQLVMATLRDVVALRRTGMISSEDKYQAILNAIASDIRSKHHRRVQRANELSTMQATLTSLRDKKRYLLEQTKSYHVYIDSSMASIQKKTKKRLVLPWSSQATHQRNLERAGKSYKFGSHFYTAQKLYDKGVLLSIDQYSPRQFEEISLTLSSNELGKFEIAVLYKDTTVKAVEVKLEDLLESQFVGKQTVEIGGVAKANLGMLVDLINHKFYAT
ncbi:BQ2448_359 [Microbotryum intermedium]|uniref:BQ2448_359 protein n=1 Tax=Microbotryum intermedium TaxID=269621 RepID=A0A238FAT2_9BASI|nr:BQ2448_359 [Microbotryum intermedium]